MCRSFDRRWFNSRGYDSLMLQRFESTKKAHFLQSDNIGWLNESNPFPSTVVQTARPCPAFLRISYHRPEDPALACGPRRPLYLDKHAILPPEKAVSRLLHSPGRVPKSSPEHPLPLPARLPVVQARQVAPAR